LASSFPHGVHSKPPSGPVLLYGVTVKRLLQISQCSNCPGAGRAFLYISFPSSFSYSESSSSSSGSPFLGFFLGFAFALPLPFLSSFFLLLMASIASFSSRLRFFLLASVSGGGCSADSSSTSAFSSPTSIDAPSPLSSASRRRRS
jgi:hypothetical protein